LLSIHVGIATLTKTPELELDETEAKRLAEALARVSRHYPILDKIGEKSIDHANLIATVGGIYGSRMVAMKFRRAAENATNVTPLRPAQ